MAAIKIDIVKDYNLLTVFYDNDTKVDQLPQTSDSSAVETILNAAKVGEWDIKLISFDLDHSRIFIFKDTFPSETQQFEEFPISGFTAGEQTTINNFIALF